LGGDANGVECVPNRIFSRPSILTVGGGQTKRRFFLILPTGARFLGRVAYGRTEVVLDLDKLTSALLMAVLIQSQTPLSFFGILKTLFGFDVNA
jgi:hypothetical protein